MTNTDMSDLTPTQLPTPDDQPPPLDPAFPLGWVPQRPDSRDFTLATRLPELLGAASPPSVLPLTTPSLSIADQGPLGSCTAFGSGRAFRFIDLKDDGSDFDVSELAQYWNARFLMGQQYVGIDSGATIRDAVKALAQYGMARETDWPYDPTRFVLKPPDSAYTYGAMHKAVEYIAVPNDVEQMKAVIAAGFPIIVGFTVYSNYGQAAATGIWPDPSGASVGGHCVLIDGYEPGYWLFPNSWGAGVGVAGRFKMSWSYLAVNGADFWILKKVSGQVPPPPPPPPSPVEQPDAIGARWANGQIRRLYPYPEDLTSLSGFPVGFGLHYPSGKSEEIWRQPGS